jgi:hypothetical protein
VRCVLVSVCVVRVFSFTSVRPPSPPPLSVPLHLICKVGLAMVIMGAVAMYGTVRERRAELLEQGAPGNIGGKRPPRCSSTSSDSSSSSGRKGDRSHHPNHLLQTNKHTSHGHGHGHIDCFSAPNLNDASTQKVASFMIGIIHGAAGPGVGGKTSLLRASSCFVLSLVICFYVQLASDCCLVTCFIACVLPAASSSAWLRILSLACFQLPPALLGCVEMLT